MSGRSKPPSVLAAFSYAPNPGRYRAIDCPVLACTRRDSPFHRILFFNNAQRVNRTNSVVLLARFFGLGRIMTQKQAVSFLCHCHDSRHPYLGTAACSVGGGTFLSSTMLPSAALSLSQIVWIRSGNKCSVVTRIPCAVSGTPTGN